MASDIRNDIDPKDRISRKMARGLAKGNRNRVRIDVRDIPAMLEDEEADEE